MKTLQKETAQSLIACIVLLLLPANVRAWEPNNNDLDAAINTGDFAGYFNNVSTWLNLKAPAEPSGISEAAMTALLKDPVLANALDQRQLLSKHEVAKVGAFATADQNNKTFLAWLLRNAPAMDLYLEGAVPLGIAAREQNSYTLHAVTLDIWKKIFNADPDSK